MKGIIQISFLLISLVRALVDRKNQINRFIVKKRDLQSYDEEWNQIRVGYVFENDESTYDQLTLAYYSNFFEVANSFLERHILIKRAYDSLSFQDFTNCAGIEFPQVLIENSIALDLIILVSLYNSTDDELLLWFSGCFTLEISSRPVMIGISINQVNLKVTSNVVDNEFAQDLIINVILSGMAFHEAYLDYFYNSQNNQKYQKVVVKLNGQYQIVTPRLVEHARQHFGCNTIEGVKLQEFSDQYAQEIFLDSTLFEYEIMSPIVDRGKAITWFTFRFLEDTGWYRLSKVQPDQYIWGYQKGCDYYNNNCTGVSKYKEFCSGEEDVGCTFNRRGIGFCNTHSNGNGCFSRINNFSLDCQDDQYIRSDEIKLLIEDAKMKFGQDSACFDGIFQTPQVAQVIKQNSGCYNYYCSETMQIIIKIGEIQYICDQPGKIYSAPSGYIGELKCPDDNNLCLRQKDCPNFCSSKGTCMGGKCYCRKKFSGFDCSEECNYMVYENICVSVCPLNTYEFDSSFCLNCGEGCISCSKTGKCIYCEMEYKLFEGFCDKKIVYDCEYSIIQVTNPIGSSVNPKDTKSETSKSVQSVQIVKTCQNQQSNEEGDDYDEEDTTSKDKIEEDQSFGKIHNLLESIFILFILLLML